MIEKRQRITINKGEREYLELLVNSDLKMRGDAMIHAVSHGSDYEDPGMDVANSILSKIANAEVFTGE